MGNLWRIRLIFMLVCNRMRAVWITIDYLLGLFQEDIFSIPLIHITINAFAINANTIPKNISYIIIIDTTPQKNDHHQSRPPKKTNPKINNPLKPLPPPGSLRPRSPNRIQKILNLTISKS